MAVMISTKQMRDAYRDQTVELIMRGILKK